MMQRALPMLVVLLTLVAATPRACAADNVSYYWKTLDVEVEVEETGDFLITETQTYVFTAPYSQERFRWIPLTSVDSITDVQVYDTGRKRRLHDPK